MVTQELRMRMACPESCFQAETSDGCAATLREWMLHTHNMHGVTLHKAIRMLCSGTLQLELCDQLAGLGPLNLFVIISGKSNYKDTHAHSSKVC
jgi:hypothetical protein